MLKGKITELRLGIRVRDDIWVLSYGSFEVNEVVKLGLRLGRVACLPVSKVDMQMEKLRIPVFFTGNWSTEPEWVNPSDLRVAG